MGFGGGVGLQRDSVLWRKWQRLPQNKTKDICSAVCATIK